MSLLLVHIIFGRIPSPSLFDSHPEGPVFSTNISFSLAHTHTHTHTSSNAPNPFASFQVVKLKVNLHNVDNTMISNYKVVIAISYCHFSMGM